MEYRMKLNDCISVPRLEPASSLLELSPEQRSELWAGVHDAIEIYWRKVTEYPVTPKLDPGPIRELLRDADFSGPIRPSDAIRLCVEGLTRYQTHTSHPSYFGLFNPRASFMGVMADTLVAAFNPQAGSWSASPFAVEVEQHVLRFFGEQFGLDPRKTHGTFTSGGSEANHTACLTALTHRFPEFAVQGVRALRSRPLIYCSTEGHHTHHRAARMCGLGADAIREIPVDRFLQMNTELLADQIRKDRKEGHTPFLVIGTAGTTNTGVIDPIAEIAAFAAREGLWFHLDAAWGGAAVLVPELRHHFEGVHLADSITLDAHKWLSVPMAAGLYLTRHADILEKTFRIDTPYVPQDTDRLDVVEPYQNSMQWSRRLIGLKVFLSLAVAGREGYAAVLRYQTRMGALLRERLQEAGWKIVNQTPLPVVCFTEAEVSETPNDYLAGIAREVLASGKAWISITRLSGNRPVLRACVTNYKTSARDVDDLVKTLTEARTKLRRLHGMPS